MRVSYNWLKEVVNIENITPEALAEKLSLHSIEVETIQRLTEATGVVIGYVKEREKHPNADKLSVCIVDVGNEDLQIVCGAPNVAAGQKVMVALPGAELAGGFKIKKSSIRGVESNGMICSLQEIGLEKKYIPEQFQDGIYVLDEAAPVGEDAIKYLGYDDYVLELGLTPNRMDLLSILGVARDVNAIYNKGLHPLKYDLKKNKKKAKDELKLRLDTSNCYSYYAKIVKNVTIKDSPAFIKARLIASGIRPINNVVDITNYILMLFGQPLHAFDQDKLGNEIVVRRAHDAEKAVTLDDQERILNTSDIVITDGERVVALGGVMGCANTEITDDTKNIVLEAAVFRPLSVRRTSSRLGLRSESSIRFERGVDLNQTLEALEYACYLLEKYADAEVLDGHVHQGIKNAPDKELNITKEYVNSYLGIDLPEEEINNIFNRLGFATKYTHNSILVKVPNRRLDITILEDLVEEIARIKGYDALKETLPLMNVNAEVSKLESVRSQTKNFLTEAGLREVVTYSLVSEAEAKLFNYLFPADHSFIKLLNPMSEEHSTLRLGLVNSLLNVISYNNARKIKDVAIYEVAKRYYFHDGQPVEEWVLAGALTGEFAGTKWDGKVEEVDFFLVKGILETLFSKLKADVDIRRITKECEELHPFRSAEIIFNDQVIGYLGAVHPKLASERDLEDTYVFEILLTELITKEKTLVQYQPISKVPSVERDLAFVVKEDIPAIDLVKAIYSVDKKLIKKVDIFDLYQGDKVEAGYRSLAFKVILEADETLTDEIINEKINKIVKSLKYQFEATLR
ncbi:MAG TPA: phenylalanine--tRNA ligase subunit beta [Acholeplasmataceae bacterium]|jgi:phenylalanyl-tRNA synthetase beta chain|nr:phenylalanine--tRNA ligase subunit beta [Acholeplasmataceae bacterium]